MNWYSLFRTLLFQLHPEIAHFCALKLLKLCRPSWLLKKYLANIPQHPVTVFGIKFPNPVGLAAGFDKNGDYFSILQSLGFGFIEVGTVTPKQQVGNPKPRLFRLPEAKALINRMGFNNLGVDYLVEKLKQRSGQGIIGVNIGKGRETPIEDAAQDYCYCLRKVYPYADYITVNLSSPNTPGLRHLQSSIYLNNLLNDLDRAQQEMQAQGHIKVPLLIKIDPDLTETALAELVTIITQHQIDGIVATNTTLNHSAVTHLPHGNETGGLSGGPLFHPSTQVVQQLSHLLANRLPIIGVGGIFSAEDAQEKFNAGASLIQIYTGLIYQGPQLVQDILHRCDP